MPMSKLVGTPMKILLTGAGGFVGQALTQQLEQNGCEVLDGDVHSTRYRLDGLNREHLTAFALEHQPTVLVHAAARTTATRDDQLDLLEVNLAGTINAMFAAREAKVKHFVLLSSAGVYEPNQAAPILESGAVRTDLAYSLSKTLAEKSCELGKPEDMTLWILRLAAIYGPNEQASGTRAGVSLIGQIAAQFLGEKSLLLPHNPRSEYNFLHTTDLARLLQIIAKRRGDKKTHLYNVGGTTISGFWILNSYQIVYGDMDKASIWEANMPPRHGAIDSSKIKKELNFRPKISLEQGLLDYPPKEVM